MAKITIRQYGKVYEGSDAFKQAAQDEIGVWMPVQRSTGCWVIERRTGMGSDDYETACHPEDGRRIYCKTKGAAQKHADRRNV